MPELKTVLPKCACRLTAWTYVGTGMPDPELTLDHWQCTECFRPAWMVSHDGGRALVIPRQLTYEMPCDLMQYIMGPLQRELERIAVYIKDIRYRYERDKMQMILKALGIRREWDLIKNTHEVPESDVKEFELLQARIFIQDEWVYPSRAPLPNPPQPLEGLVYLQKVARPESKSAQWYTISREKKCT